MAANAKKPVDRLKLEEALQLANTYGHDMVEDAMHSVSVFRVTCTRCGRAILSYQNNAYGSATEVQCNREVNHPTTHPKYKQGWNERIGVAAGMSDYGKVYHAEVGYVANAQIAESWSLDERQQYVYGWNDADAKIATLRIK